MLVVCVGLTLVGLVASAYCLLPFVDVWFVIFCVCFVFMHVVVVYVVFCCC